MVNVTNVVKEIKRILRDKDIFFRYVNAVNEESYEIILETGRNEHFVVYKEGDKVTCMYYRMVVASDNKMEIRYHQFISDLNLYWDYLEYWVTQNVEGNIVLKTKKLV